MNPFYHDLSDVDLCFSRVLYTTSIVYWARVVIDRVPSCISKPVAGSEGHQTAGMDRSDQGFHTFAISLPLPPNPSFFGSLKFHFSSPPPAVNISTTGSQSNCSVPQTTGWNPPRLLLGAISQEDKQWQSVSSGHGHYPFPNPTYCATLDDLPSFSRLSMVFFAPGLRLYHLELLFLLAQAHSEQLEHIS